MLEKDRQFERARVNYERALAIYERALGAEHKEVATVLYSLADMYLHQGKLGEAEPLFRRALAIREKTLEPRSPQLAATLGGYATLLQKNGPAQGSR